MPHDWVRSASRMMNTLSGYKKKVDKVPFFPIIDEQFATRIVGRTAKEMLSSPKLYAKSMIMSAEFIRADSIQLPSAYAGPAEAYAFAEANDGMDLIEWYDYKPLAIKQGELCKTEEDIEKLEIPNHTKSGLWKTTYAAAKIIQKKTKYPQNMGLGLWSVVQELRGVQAYRDIKQNPDLLLKLCKKIFESQINSYNAWIEEVGSCSIILYPAYAFNRHMMSFQDAMQFEGQFIKKFQDKIKVPFILHNCGTSPYFEEICEQIEFIAVNGSHPLDIEYWIQFQKKFPNITIMGANIDVSREMFSGTALEVKEKVKENILNLAPTGRYICGPICCLPWGVPIPNILAIPEAIEKYGKYPIEK